MGRDLRRRAAASEQRVAALNAFPVDIYGEQRILDEGVLPREFIASCGGYRKAMRGVVPPSGSPANLAAAVSRSSLQWRVAPHYGRIVSDRSLVNVIPLAEDSSA